MPSVRRGGGRTWRALRPTRHRPQPRSQPRKPGAAYMHAPRHDDPDRRMCGPDPADGLDALRREGRWHPDVGEDRVELLAPDSLEQRFTVADRRDHRDAI